MVQREQPSYYVKITSAHPELKALAMNDDDDDDDDNNNNNNNHNKLKINNNINYKNNELLNYYY
jgi:hypothetical protein